MRNSWKRVASGALALAIVASNVTANVEWGGLLDSTITASAENYTPLYAGTVFSVGDTIIPNQTTYYNDSYSSMDSYGTYTITKYNNNIYT